MNLYTVETMTGEAPLSSSSPSYVPSVMYGDAVEVTPVVLARPSLGVDRFVATANHEAMAFPSLSGSPFKKARIQRYESFASSSSSEDSVDAAILLTAMRSIASRELLSSSQEVTPVFSYSNPVLANTSADIDQLAMPILSLGTSSSEESHNVRFLAPEMQYFSQSIPESGPGSKAKNSENEGPWWSVQQASLESSRMRAVSFDDNNRNHTQQPILDLTTSSPSQESVESTSLGSATPELKQPPVVHSYVTPTGKRKKIDGPATIVIAPGKGKSPAPHKHTGAMKTILRRKFSWKNYPELEAFLVANREEYLRHSTLNYTVQQKQFNNRLTEQLIELAEQHGYVFDPSAFNFVTIRDRIRCYFKSYVQSSKKRGVIIGYAAKRAGLVTDRDLEDSASTAGKIIVPT
jgi:hypothetical protein